MTPPDPTQIALAAQIVTLLAVPFVQGVAKQVGQDAFSQAKTLATKVRERFRQDKNEKASKTLDLFQDDPETFGEPLSRLLAATLAEHPDWGEEMRALLAQPASQEIVARNKAKVEDITMRISRAGQQRIEADDSYVGRVEMDITGG